MSKLKSYEKQIAEAPSVYGDLQSMGWTAIGDEYCTHRARLIQIEKIKT